MVENVIQNINWIMISVNGVHKSENTSINPSNKTNYCLIAVILLTIAYLKLLNVITIKHCMKRGFTIPCLL